MRYRHRHNSPDGIIVRPEDRVEFSPAAEVIHKSGDGTESESESFSQIFVEVAYKLLWGALGAAIVLMIVGK